MKKNKGLSLIELIVSIALLSVVLLFLYSLVKNIIFSGDDNTFDNKSYTSLIVDNVSNDLITYGFAYNENIEYESLLFKSEPNRYEIIFNTTNGSSNIVFDDVDNKNTITYRSVDDKLYKWKLDNNIKFNLDSIYNELSVMNDSDDNVLYRLVIPVFSTDSKDNYDINNNNVDDDVIIEYFGKAVKVSEVIETEEEGAPKRPIIKVRDKDGNLREPISGEKHLEEFSLVAEDGGSTYPEDVYFVWTTKNSVTKEGPEVNVTKDDNKLKFSVKACYRSTNKCSLDVEYNIRFLIIPKNPTITASPNQASGTTFYAPLTLDANVTDSKQIEYIWTFVKNATTITQKSKKLSINDDTDLIKYSVKACYINEEPDDERCSGTVTFDARVSLTPTNFKLDSHGAVSGQSSSVPIRLTVSAENATYYQWSYNGNTTKSNELYLNTNTNLTKYKVKACNAYKCTGELAFDAIINIPQDAITISANDGISSGNWHKKNYYLVANKNDATYFKWYRGNTLIHTINSSKSSQILVSNESAGETYRVEGCNNNGCVNISYNSKLDKTAPRCTISVTDNYGYNFGSNEYPSYANISFSCSDNLTSSYNIYKYSNYSSCSSSCTVSSSRTISFSATDEAGNTYSNSKSIYFNNSSQCGCLSYNSCASCGCNQYNYTYSFGSYSSTSSSGTSVSTCNSSNVGRYQYRESTDYNYYRQRCNESNTYSFVSSGTSTSNSNGVTQCNSSTVGRYKYGTGSCSKTSWQRAKCNVSFTKTNMKTVTVSSKPSISSTCTSNGSYIYTSCTCTGCARAGSPPCTTPRNNTCNKWSCKRYTCSASYSFGSYTSTTSSGSTTLSCNSTNVGKYRYKSSCSSYTYPRQVCQKNSTYSFGSRENASYLGTSVSQCNSSNVGKYKYTSESYKTYERRRCESVQGGCRQYNSCSSCGCDTPRSCYN